MKVVLMFPGQSSRHREMLPRIVEAWPPGAAIVDAASKVLARDLWRAFDPDRADMFDRNQDIQVSVFLASYLHQRALADSGVAGDLSLGLSLGEYNHLVHIGAIPFQACLSLVDARGAAYDAGPTGMMAAVFPLALEELEPLVAGARRHGIVEVANQNSPSQNVIAGDRSAVEAAIELIEQADPSVHVAIIENRIPMHTTAFAPVASVLGGLLERAPITTPSKPYVPNLIGDIVERPDAAFIRRALEQHVFKPVLWRRSIDALADRYGGVCFIEVGPGSVLFNLLSKRWQGGRKFQTDGPEGIAASIAAVADELRRVA